MATPRPALAALAALYLAGAPLPPADPRELTAAQSAVLKTAREVQAGCFENEDDAQYRARAVLVAESLELGARAEEASKTYPACARRVAGGYASPALEAQVLDKLVKSEGVAVERRERAEKRLKALAATLSFARGDAGQLPDPFALAQDGAAGRSAVAAGTPLRPGAAPRDAASLARELNAAEAARPGLVRPTSVSVPEPTEYHALAGEEVAPQASVLDKAASLVARDGQTIAEDLRTISSSLAEAELPSARAINEGNPDAIRQFFVWLKSVQPGNLPVIDYGILDKGLVGRYELGLMSKGTITLNHFIRDAPARARATVLVHELYHYWDKKIAKNYYPNVSYGRIGEGTQHIHEYDAYLATSLYWRMVKQEGETSPLARMLDRVPVEANEIQALVDGAVRR